MLSKVTIIAISLEDALKTFETIKMVHPEITNVEINVEVKSVAASDAIFQIDGKPLL